MLSKQSCNKLATTLSKLAAWKNNGHVTGLHKLCYVTHFHTLSFCAFFLFAILHHSYFNKDLIHNYFFTVHNVLFLIHQPLITKPLKQFSESFSKLLLLPNNIKICGIVLTLILTALIFNLIQEFVISLN